MNNFEKNSQQKPWWNRPLLGQVSLIERTIGAINRKPLPELALSLHDTEIEELNKIAPTLQMLDKDKYNNQFLLYVNIKNKVENNLDEYKDLHTFIKILSFAIHHSSYFKTIQRMELDYQGKTQGDLYELIEQQLYTNPDRFIFKKIVNEEINKLINKVINEPTKQALISYKEALNAIAEDEIGLSLLLLLKKYKVVDYSIFNTISDILLQFRKQDLENLKALVLVVKVNIEHFEKLGRLIGIPHESNEPIVLAKIIQYIALTHKYENLNYRFKQLTDNLIKWEKHYQTVLEVRQEYPRHKYQIHENFVKVIPGENIYLKYKDYLNY